MTENANTQPEQEKPSADHAMALLLAVSMRFHYQDGSYGFMNKFTSEKSKIIWKMACEPFKNAKHAKMYDIKDPKKGVVIANCLIVDPQHPGFNFLQRYAAARREYNTTEETKQVTSLRAAYMNQLGHIGEDYSENDILSAHAKSAYKQKKEEEILLMRKKMQLKQPSP